MNTQTRTAGRSMRTGDADETTVRGRRRRPILPAGAGHRRRRLLARPSHRVTNRGGCRRYHPVDHFDGGSWLHIKVDVFGIAARRRGGRRVKPPTNGATYSLQPKPSAEKKKWRKTKMLILCTFTALQIFSMPAGPIVVGDAPPNAHVEIHDTSMLRDWVFISKPEFDKAGNYLGSTPRGWVPYAGLGRCN